MKADGIYTAILAYTEGLPEDERGAVKRLTAEGKIIDPPYFPLMNLSNALIICREEMNRAAAKESGRSAALTAAKAILKDTPDSRPILQYANRTADGKQEMLNGWCCVRLNDPLPLPERPAGMLGDFPALDGILRLTGDERPVTLPTIAELKAYIADITAKAKAGAELPERGAKMEGKKIVPIWKFADAELAADATKLLHILQVFPDPAAVTALNNHPLHAIHLADGAGDEAVLLPVRMV